MTDRVLACILAFYPGDKFEDVCNAISAEVSFLLIVDNSPDSSLRPDDISLPGNTAIIHNKNNGAVAGALNIALRHAKTEQFDYLQIFDQDTVPSPGMAIALIKTIAQNPDVALVSPRFINLNTGYPGRVMLHKSKWHVKSIWPETDIGLLSALFTINSSALINVRSVPADIFYDERLIIDGCDVDFCLALRERGLEILVDTSQCIVHGIGNRKNGGGRWSPTNYSAARKYLMAKNRIMVWRRYLKNYPGFVLNDIYVFLLDTARTVFLEKEKLKKIKAIAKGVAAGFREKQITVRTQVQPVPRIPR
ncbi:glycosyltransferase [Mucilaginibacter sp. CAU 1740]|uniref:glycosyltransferase n=1 Tax=Mucilaginibacter sp. CAU 1740 TaxID=3140365 RepID=UPI00325B6594